MDNTNNSNLTTLGNQPIQPPSAPQPPVSPLQASPPPQSSPPAGPALNSGGKKLIFIAGGVLFILLLGVIYFLAVINSAGQKTAPEVTPIPQTQRITPTVSPTPSDDIETIDLGDPEEDLKDIEADLEQL